MKLDRHEEARCRWHGCQLETAHLPVIWAGRQICTFKRVSCPACDEEDAREEQARLGTEERGNV